MFSCCKVLFVYEFLLKFFLRVFFFKWSFFDEKSNGFQKYLLWKWSYWVGQIQCQFKLRACHKIDLPPRRGLPSVRQTLSLKEFYLNFFKQKFSVKLATLSDLVIIYYYILYIFFVVCVEKFHCQQRILSKFVNSVLNLEKILMFFFFLTLNFLV